MKRAYGKFELNVRELKCQKIYEKLKSPRKAQSQKIRNGVKKSFKISSEALSVIKQLVEKVFLMEFKEQEKTFLTGTAGGILPKIVSWYLNTL